ncbi:MAG: hypothetical protein WDA00_06005 [Eubacteriales bacterium]
MDEQMINHYEYTVDKKVQGRYRLRRLGMIGLYVLFALSYLLVCVMTIPHLIALLPLFVLILCLATWRYCCISYRYEFASGRLQFFVIYQNRKPLLRYTAVVKDALYIGAYDASLRTEGKAVKTLDFRAAPTDSYCLLCHAEQGEVLVLFDATEKLVSLLRRYNSKTKVVKELLV